MPSIISSAQPAVSPEAVPACVDSLSRILRQSETDSLSGPSLDHEATLVTYTVSGDALTDPVFAGHLRQNLKKYQQDTAGQEKIWNFFTDIIPADRRTHITRLVIFTDGAGNSLGALEQADNPHDWMLEMDMLDAGDFSILSTTLVHEFGHLLTLDDTQVAVDEKIFDNPDDQQIYNQEAAACPTYFMYEGCSRPDSYINSFFQRFWPDIYAEWQGINATTNPDTLDAKLETFAYKYAGQFVDDYAATSPEEDIAESFVYFIFRPKLSGSGIAGQKYAFFYDYPELVSLRERILAHLCTYVKEP